jgi:hypothetical protein
VFVSAAITDTLIIVAVALTLARTIGLGFRANEVRREAGVAQIVAQRPRTRPRPRPRSVTARSAADSLPLIEDLCAAGIAAIALRHPGRVARSPERRIRENRPVTRPNMSDEAAIDPSVPPSGTGCVECMAAGGWWLHLRRCAQCGHIGCCDSSPSQHASHHAADAGHPLIRSFEPGEDWYWNYRTEQFYDGPQLAPPEHHPLDQPTPGPAGRVPPDWQRHLH